MNQRTQTLVLVIATLLAVSTAASLGDSPDIGYDLLLKTAPEQFDRKCVESKSSRKLRQVVE